MSGDEEKKTNVLAGADRRSGSNRDFSPRTENLARLVELLSAPDGDTGDRVAAARAIEQIVPHIGRAELEACEATLGEIDRQQPPHEVWIANRRLINRLSAWRQTGRDVGRAYVIELSEAERRSVQRQLSHCFEDRYEIVREISTGGMGRVFEALRVADGVTVVVKFLLDAYVGRPELEARFRREAEVMAGIAHPNVVRLIDHGAKDGSLYLVMEYMDGGSLDRLVGADELDNARISRILSQVCDGLQAVHAAGIVHRDLKPGNVLLDADDRAKLTDFGLAMARGGRRLTRPFEEFGTGPYMAPEQKRSSGEVDRLADIWSLGVMTYELFSGGEFPEVDYRPLAQLRAGLLPALDDVVRRCLRVEPRERWNDAVQFRDALTGAMES